MAKNLGNGGVLFSQESGTLTLTAVTFSYNFAEGGGGDEDLRGEEEGVPRPHRGLFLILVLCFETCTAIHHKESEYHHHEIGVSSRTSQICSQTI